MKTNNYNEEKGNKYIEKLKQLENKEVEVTTEGFDEPLKGTVKAINWYHLNIIIEEVEGKTTIIKNPITIREL